MRRMFENDRFTMALLVACIVAGYLGFRYFYQVSGDFPFSQELLLVFIGAVATVLITALLLNRQTELELRKEGQVLLLDQKSAVYSALIEHLGAIVESGTLERDELARLRVLNHKIAMFGSAEVISRFSEVLGRLDAAVADQSMTDAERNRIMQSVAVLTYYMRADLLGRIEGEDQAAVLAAIKSNNADLEH
ncbi:hypothetical protein ACFQBU_09555 [Jhaorihella thermophila]|uniref:Uncharacterized protein n=2 Tax=Jhaorihella thermophila TaxID=488547 RepID=A0A1H5XXL4_9RHOB|nr:hypothetical protein SAMN05421751_11323 [Jhaorihella thermophila]